MKQFLIVYPQFQVSSGLEAVLLTLQLSSHPSEEKNTIREHLPSLNGCKHQTRLFVREPEAT